MAFEVVETFGSLWEAGIAKSVLEVEGVPAVIDGETTAQIAPFCDFWQRGARLLVPEEQLAQAAEILAKWREGEATAADGARHPE